MKVKAQFICHIDEAADTTEYEVNCNDGECVIRITNAGVQFDDVQRYTHSAMMRITQIAWDEFEARNEWSDFELMIEV